MKELQQILPVLLKGAPLKERQQKLLIGVAKKIEQISNTERDAEQWFVLGAKAQLEQDLDEAEFCYAEAIRLQDDFEAAYQRRGLILAEQENYEEALASLDKAISLDDQFLDAYVSRAAVYSATEAYDKALADLDFVLSVDEENISAIAEKSALYEAQDDYVKAAEELQPLIDRFPADAELLSKRALYSIFGGKPEDAITDLVKVQTMQGSNAINDFNLGLAYGLASGYSKDALQKFERAFKKHAAILSMYHQSAKEKDWKRLYGKVKEIIEVQKNDDSGRGKFYRDNLIDFLSRQIKSFEA